MTVRGVPAFFVTVLASGAAIAIGAGLSTVTRLRPDLVLLVVIAVAFAGGAAYGAVTGFCSGLVLDLAPFSANIVGTGALAFTIVGYLAGVVSLVWRPESRVMRFVRPIAVTAGGTAVLASVFAFFTVIFDENRFGLSDIPDLLPTIALAPLVVPGMVALFRRWS